MWPTTLCSSRVFTTFGSSQVLHDRGQGQWIGVLTIDASPVYGCDFVWKRETGCHIGLRLVWLCGGAWHGRSALLYCAITGGVWSPDGWITLCCFVFHFIPLVISFICPFFSSVKNFEQHFPARNTSQTRMITISFSIAVLYFSLLFHHLTMDSVRGYSEFWLWKN